LFTYYDGVDNISEEIKLHPKYKYSMLFLAGLIMCLPVATASSVGAYNVKVTPEFVKATALCSCGLTDYTYHTKAFKNYCPHCGSYGTLIFNPKGVPEGEWTCTKCKSDYCAADGKEKMPNTRYYLTPYTAPKVQSQGVPGNKVDHVINDIDKYKDRSFLGFE
jgi:hypothetical protein